MRFVKLNVLMEGIDVSNGARYLQVTGVNGVTEFIARGLGAAAFAVIASARYSSRVTPIDQGFPTGRHTCIGIRAC